MKKETPKPKKVEKKKEMTVAEMKAFQQKGYKSGLSK